MTTIYIDSDPIVRKSFELFPNNSKYRKQWIENYKHLKSINKLALDTGGWIIDGGKFLNEYDFSVLKEK